MLKSNSFIALLCFGCFTAGLFIGLKLSTSPASNPDKAAVSGLKKLSPATNNSDVVRAHEAFSVVVQQNNETIRRTENLLRQYEEPWPPETERHFQKWMAEGLVNESAANPSH